MTIDETELMEQCPKFNHCSAPKCPLDYYQDERTRLKGEPICKAKKETRFKIGKDSSLKFKGLTKSEYSWMMSGAKRFRKFFSYLKKNRKLAINDNENRPGQNNKF